MLLPRPAALVSLIFLFFVGVRLLLPLPGLSAPGHGVLAVTVCGFVLWMSDALPLGATALLVLALLGTVPGVTPERVFAGFASPVVFFLLGSLVLGVAVEQTGLAARAARTLTRGARGNPTRLYAQLLLGMPVLALMVPSAITRNTVLIPAYESALGAMTLGRGSRVGRAVMLALGVLHPLASSMYLTGGTASMTAATLLGGFPWLRWFALMSVVYAALLVLGGTVLWLMLRPFEPGRATGSASRDAADPITPAEWRVLAVVTLTAVLWLSDAVHRLSPAIPALLGATLLLAPVTGVVGWKEFERRVSWGLVLTVGSSLSLAIALADSGAAAWLGARAASVLGELSAWPTASVAALVVLVATVHLAVTNLPACIALLVPVASAAGPAAGLDATLCGLVVLIAVDSIVFYPVQTATNLLAYESGFFGAADVRRFGVAMLGVTIFVVVAVALPYWRALDVGR